MDRAAWQSRCPIKTARHHYATQGPGLGYTGVRGPNTLLATVTGPGSTPVIVTQRLRTRSHGS